eukprot:GHUV01010578.1.p3 GENE.GHUV01010578.1~~GHUV01010578.1.p3  ORF type:complete len:112 (+),score=32.76 GHUV01010578.1:2878-3213(+)
MYASAAAQLVNCVIVAGCQSSIMGAPTQQQSAGTAQGRHRGYSACWAQLAADGTAIAMAVDVASAQSLLLQCTNSSWRCNAYTFVVGVRCTATGRAFTAVTCVLRCSCFKI